MTNRLVSVLGKNINMKIKTKNNYPSIPAIKEKQGIPYFHFKGLEETGAVKHLFSTRLGGISEGEFRKLSKNSKNP